MGGIVSRWMWGGDPDEKEPTSGMSRRDVYKVQKSWAVINANASANGFLIFIRIFRASPESKTLFKNVSQLSEEELSSSVPFKAHVVFFMSAMNAAVENLPRPELVVTMMEKLGDSHHNRNVRREYFLVFKEELSKILQNDLKFDADTVSAWMSFIDFINKHILSKIPA